MRSIDPCPKCGGDKTAQRANSPTAVLRSPSRFSGEAVTVLLSDGLVFNHYIFPQQ